MSSMMIESLKLIASRYQYFEIDDSTNIADLKLDQSDDKSIGIILQEKVVSSTQLICNIRIAEELQNGFARCPIIIVSYRTTRSIIKSEKYPRLMSSRGIYYVKLPAGIEEIGRTFDIASKCTIDNPRDEVRNLLPSQKEMTRIESIVIHDLGNFFGSEKILYGACFAGRIDSKDALENIKKIKNAQNTECRVNTSELELYRLLDNKFDMQLNKLNLKKDTTATTINGNILLIDDLAHLGWADAIASVRWGADYSEDIYYTDTFVKITEFKSVSSDYILRAVSNANRSNEDKFIETLKAHLHEYITLDIDIILLDFRLRRVEDEKANDPEKTSGLQLLKLIREINPAIPVCVFTASRKAANMELAIDYGADEYFVKTAIDNDDDPKEYFTRFEHILRKLWNRSYLGVLWNIYSQADQGISSRIRESITVDSIRENLLKLIALCKIQNTKSNYEYFNFSANTETIINIDLTMKAVTIKNIDILRKTFDKGILVRNIRNQLAHVKALYDTNDVVQQSSEDKLVAIYSFIRYYFNLSPGESSKLFNCLFPDLTRLNSNLVVSIDGVNLVFKTLCNDKIIWFRNRSSEPVPYNDWDARIYIQKNNGIFSLRDAVILWSVKCMFEIGWAGNGTKSDFQYLSREDIKLLNYLLPSIVNKKWNTYFTSKRGMSQQKKR